MTFWTDERDEALRDLAPHHSASVIAERFGCSRNAVIGRCARRGIPLGKPKSEKQGPRPQMPAPPTPEGPQPGRHYQTRPGFFRVICKDCRETSDEFPATVAHVAEHLRRKGYTSTFLHVALSAWSCPTCTPPKIRTPKAVICVPIPPPTGEGKLIWELGNYDCCWPLGDPLTDEFRYCGHPKFDKRYCQHHAQVSVRK